MLLEDEFHSTATSSSEEERDDRIRSGENRAKYQTPFKGNRQFLRSSSTPLTVTQMTPSPIRTPLIDSASLTPGNAAPTKAPGPSPPSFLSMQQGYLDHSVSTALFQDSTPSRTRRKGRASSRRSRLSQSLLLDNYECPKLPQRRRISHRKQASFGSAHNTPVNSSPDLSSIDTSSPHASPGRHNGSPHSQRPSLIALEYASSIPSKTPRGGAKSVWFLWGFLALALTSSLGMVGLTRSAVQLELQAYEPTRPEIHLSAAGLRGQMTSGHWEKKEVPKKAHTKTGGGVHPQHPAHKYSHHHTAPQSASRHGLKHHPTARGHGTQRQNPSRHYPKMNLPPPSAFTRGEPKFAPQDLHMYSRQSSHHRRVVALDPSNDHLGQKATPPRNVKLNPADFTDNTQLYSILGSSDERLSHMERRDPYSQGECVPMQEWQTTFHPSCNGMHEIAIEKMGEENSGSQVQLFGTKGFWRYAWRLDVQNVHQQDTMVLKTLKYEHNFEDAHFEHDRIDAVAMERLTSSPHVINVFGFCGHSVLTEYADGSRVGELADKSKKKPLARLKIARDIAHGLADVHGIDGDGNATFVHLDVNPANVVSIGGTLKLNDFNIGIIRRWNTTSNTPCGFPAQYPNPQWRSPEEARNEQNLTEKVDIFSMGHIFFRLICGHEPWNKLEPGGRPSKEEVSNRVQQGDLPYIPDHVRNSENPEVTAIRDAMLSCYTFDPVQRPSARDIATVLDQALEVLSNNPQ